MWDTRDTIAAVASAREGGLRGIVRISGPQAADCLARVFRAATNEELRSIRRPCVVAGTVSAGPPLGDVPADVYLWPTERSYTRQPCAEIHTIGSVPLLDALLAAACQAGARVAQPGEFTLRAFLAGRLDLTQAEAVLGVIDARSANELDVALNQLAGGLARPLQELRDRLLDVLAQLEAGLDFADEDLEFIGPEQLRGQLRAAHDALEALRRQIAGRQQSSDEARVVLVGSPNVGKSSLFNALAGFNSAIVADAAGTTRDFVTHRLELEGRAILLVDTAGFAPAPAADGLTQAAERAAGGQSRQATLQLWCLDATRAMNGWERAALEHESGTPRLVVRTKCDRPWSCDYSGSAIATSSRTGEGLDRLRRSIGAFVDAAGTGEAAVVAQTAVRCQDSLLRAALGLERALELARTGQGDELVAAEVRAALDELGTVAGVVYTDDVLDRVFSRFCIGK